MSSIPEFYPQHVLRPCSVCGLDFATDNPHRVYCSARCMATDAAAARDRREAGGDDDGKAARLFRAEAMQSVERYIARHNLRDQADYHQ